MEWLSINGEMAEKFRSQGYSTSGSNTTTITNGTSNAKGGWQLVAPGTSFDSSGLLVFLDGDFNSDLLIDISTTSGTAGMFVNNLLVSAPPSAVDYVYFPLFIPANSSIWMRSQATLTSRTFQSAVIFVPKGNNDLRLFTRCSTYGAQDSGATDGTVVNPTGTINHWSAWIEITPSTSYPMDRWMVVLGDRSNGTMTTGNFALQIGIGSAGNEIPIFTQPFQSNAQCDAFVPRFSGLIPIHIPAGTRMTVRGCTSITDATDRQFSVVLCGFG